MTTDVDEFLEHYGVLGMKWGVRKEPTYAIVSTMDANKPKMVKIEGDRYSKQGLKKLNKDFIKSFYAATSSPEFSKTVEALDKKYFSKNVNMSFEDYKKYRAEFAKALEKELFKDIDPVLNGRVVSSEPVYDKKYNPNEEELTMYAVYGRKDLVDEFTKDIENRNKALRHQEISEEFSSFKIVVKRSNGKYDGLKITEDSVAHMDPVDEFLQHYGVLGMKWGVRKDNPAIGVETHVNSGGNGIYTTTNEQGKTPSRKDRKALAKISETLHFEMFHEKGQLRGEVAKAVNNGIKKYGYPSDRSEKQADAYRRYLFTELEKIAKKELPEGLNVMFSDFNEGVAYMYVGTPPFFEAFGEDLKHVDQNSNLGIKVKLTPEVLELFQLGFKESTTMKHNSISSKVDDFLAHYGVLGMKWGVRKSKNSRNSSTSNESSHEPLSDQELRERVNRILLERQYYQLTAPQKSNASKFVSEVLTKSAKKAATDILTKTMTNEGQKFVDALIKSSKKKK